MLAGSLVFHGSNIMQLVVGGALGGLAYVAVVIPAGQRAQVFARVTSWRR